MPYSIGCDLSSREQVALFYAEEVEVFFRLSEFDASKCTLTVTPTSLRVFDVFQDEYLYSIFTDALICEVNPVSAVLAYRTHYLFIAHSRATSTPNSIVLDSSSQVPAYASRMPDESHMVRVTHLFSVS